MVIDRAVNPGQLGLEQRCRLVHSPVWPKFIHESRPIVPGQEPLGHMYYHESLQDLVTLTVCMTLFACRSKVQLGPGHTSEDAIETMSTNVISSSATGTGTHN